MTQRSLALATASLAVVVLVMVLSLTLVVGLARSAERDADEARIENTDLRVELSCRSLIASEFAVTQGRLLLAISIGLVTRWSDQDLTDIQAELVAIGDQLRTAVDGREAANANCKVD